MDDRKHSYRHYRLDCRARLPTLFDVMDQPVLHKWTHDSISVGEDGPTHQPIEQIVSLRAIPGMIVIRPADANEMTEAYRFVLGLKNRPAALICSRQALPISDRGQFAPASQLAQGGYILVDILVDAPAVGADEDRRRAFRVQCRACGRRRQKYHAPRGRRNKPAR